MKQIINTLILITILSFLSGCAQDEYAIEREYWYIQRQVKRIFDNPHASPPMELKKAVERLSSFSEKYPAKNLAVEAEFTIARLYFLKQEYASTRAQLEKIINKYVESDNIRANAIFLIGNSYEIQNNWSSALDNYKRIQNEYPTTLRGMTIPIYIAQHYKVASQNEKMTSAYQAAISHYKQLADKYPNSPLSYNAHTLIAQCYAALQDWENAIASYNIIVEKYTPQVRDLDKILLNMALIYEGKLNDNDKARETLQKLLKEYPKSRLTNPANALLDKMEEGT